MKGMRAFSAEEVERIRESFGGKFAARDRCLFEIGQATGFRVAELLSLRVGDVWRGGEVVPVVAVARKSMKGKGAGRTVPLREDAKASVREWVAEMERVGLPVKAESALFQSQKGRGRAIQYRQALEIVQGACAAAGVVGAVGTHSMRKTFAMRVYRASGENLLLTQKALDHAAVNSTVHYLATADEDVFRAILL